MGKTKGAYNAEFPVGTSVRIAGLSTLRKFISDWTFHNPLAPEQLTFADRVAKVQKVGYYHGGDELYSLEGIPGLWHEENLQAHHDAG